MGNTRIPILAVLCLLQGCDLMAGPDTDDQSATLLTEGGLFMVTFVPLPNPIPFNQLFELDVRVEDLGGAPARDADLSVFASMPFEGHAIDSDPIVIERGDGGFVVQGMRFDRRGPWLLELWVDDGVNFDRAAVEIECCAE
ncbi:MAG: hypothetical protein CME06_14675 [Gemmatimonadetes bacterium]|nr:hypothetical protein [Gemmatimonadota bacterium]